MVPADVRFGIRSLNSMRDTLPLPYSGGRMGYHASTLFSFFSDRIGRTVSNVQKVIGESTQMRADNVNAVPDSGLIGFHNGLFYQENIFRSLHYTSLSPPLAGNFR